MAVGSGRRHRQFRARLHGGESCVAFTFAKRTENGARSCGQGSDSFCVERALTPHARYARVLSATAPSHWRAPALFTDRFSYTLRRLCKFGRSLWPFAARDAPCHQRQCCAAMHLSRCHVSAVIAARATSVPTRFSHALPNWQRPSILHFVVSLLYALASRAARGALSLDQPITARLPLKHNRLRGKTCCSQSKRGSSQKRFT